MRKFLQKLAEKITRTKRYKPEDHELDRRIHWSKQVWVSNIFRAHEWLWGRKYGIRAETSTAVFYQNGKLQIKREFYTLESLLSHIEVTIRGYFLLFPAFFTYPQLELNYRPVYVTFGILGLFLSFKAPQHMLPLFGLAIAFDSETAGTTATTSPLTFAHTCTGSNLLLSVGVINNGGSGVGISTPTYNSVSMSEVGFQQITTTNVDSALYFLTGPSTGSNTVSVGATNIVDFNAVAVSYTGASQSGQPDATGGNTGGAGTSPSVTVTTVADNSWVVGIAAQSNMSGPNLTDRSGLIAVGGTIKMQYTDTNGVVHPAGNQTISWSSTGIWTLSAGSIAPVGAAGDTISVTDSPSTSENVKMDLFAMPSVSDSTTTSENVKIMMDENPVAVDTSTVVDKVSYFPDLVLISDVPTATPTFPTGLNIDLNITGNALGVNAVSTHTFSTAYANEVLIALVTINTASGNDPIVSGGGLTWVQVTKRDTQNAPNAYIYRAFAASPLTNARITATAPDSSNYDIQITVLSFLGADQTGSNGSGAIGASAVGGNTGTTKPTLSLNTTRAGSFVVGTYGYNNNETLVADTGQTVYGQQQDNPNTTAMASLGQNATTPASGTNVTVDLTNSSGWDWNGAIVEVLAALQLANINVSDSPTTSESVTVIPTIGNISVNDATTTSESVAVSPTDFISVNDATTTTENVKMNKEADPVVSDSTSTTENIQISMSADIISDFDATTTSEATTVTVSADIINVNDATTTSESIKMEMDNFVSVNDATTTTENIHTMTIDNINVNDATTTSENISLALTGQNVVSDAVTTSENVKMELDNFVSVNDAPTTSEFVNPQITVDFINVVDAILATDIRRNFVTNPSFEGDTVGSNPPSTYTAFTTINTGSLTPQVASDSSFSGSQSWKITVSGGHADAGLTSPRYTVNPGQYTISHYMRTALSAGGAHMHVKVYSGSNVTAEYDLAGASGTTGWTRYSTTIQLLPTDTAIELWIGFGTFGDSLATGTVWYDALQIEAGSLSSYFDGSYAAANWDGSANASTSSTALTVQTIDIVDVDVVSDSVTTSESVTVRLTIQQAMPSPSSGEHQGLILWS